MIKNYTLIDLFAGAGGLSEGFIKQGFHAIAHIEMNKDATNTLKTRAAFHYLVKQKKRPLYNKYISGLLNRNDFFDQIPRTVTDGVLNVTLSKENIHSVFNSIDKLSRCSSNKEIDIIVGGPPCQAYSLIGRAVKNDGMQSDPRNDLYVLYGMFLEKYSPKMFVFENVPGLLSAKDGYYMDNIKDYFESIGYIVDFRVLNAIDFGALQNRKRVIIIGWKRQYKLKYPDLIKRRYDNNVRDLLIDLPVLQPGEQKSEYKSQPTEYLKLTKIRENQDILTQHIARPCNNNDREIYKYAIASWDNKKKRIKYSDLPEHLITHQNKNVFTDRYKVVAGDLNTSQTIMAHIAKDGHYFIHPDINQARSISVREAARIQSFPDNYFFEGSRTSVFTQIGNAVPPLLSEAIAQGLKSILEEVSYER